jgi:hypothetical protein
MQLYLYPQFGRQLKGTMHFKIVSLIPVFSLLKSESPPENSLVEPK